MTARFPVCRSATILLFLTVYAVPRTQAQQTTGCNVNVAVAPTVRSEGFTELTGDVVMSCFFAGQQPGSPVPAANITIFFNTTVTSRLLPNATDTNLSEVLLLIDDPAPGKQT